MLLYATIDGMAWYVLKNVDGDVTEDNFRSWVPRYMFEGDNSEQLSSVDLYAARCVMLHSQIAESRKSKHEVRYQSNDGSGLVPVFGLNTPRFPASKNCRN